MRSDVGVDVGGSGDGDDTSPGKLESLNISHYVLWGGGVGGDGDE